MSFSLQERELDFIAKRRVFVTKKTRSACALSGCPNSPIAELPSDLTGFPKGSFCQMLAPSRMAAMRLPTAGLLRDGMASFRSRGNRVRPVHSRRWSGRQRMGLSLYGKSLRRRRCEIRLRGLRKESRWSCRDGRRDKPRLRRKRTGLDHDQTSHRHQFVKGKDVPIPHPNTTVACRLTHQGLLVGAMDVDSPAIGIAVPLLQAAQPENPSEQAVMAGCRSVLQVDPFPRISSVIKLPAQWDPVADFILNHESAQGSPKAIRLVAQPEAGGRNRKAVRRRAVLYYLESLIVHAHADKGGGLVVRGGDAA